MERHVPDRSRRRASRVRVRARAQIAESLRRIGIGLREKRLALGLRQSDVAAKAGVSQSFYSELERGVATVVAVETVAACAAALDLRLATFLESTPGADRPRDAEHLRRQALVIDYAAGGGWRARPEHSIDPSARRSRSIDVLLERPERREAAVVEIVDLIVDGGDMMRGLSDKVAAVTRDHAFDEAHGGDEWSVSGFLVVRGTRRNRRVITDASAVFRSAYPASSSVWLRALADPRTPMPRQTGLGWTDIRGTRLMTVRWS
jgi:transcriptional regulator with XRE-family HTH domain